MRKIEIEMIAAIRAVNGTHAEWKQGNTYVHAILGGAEVQLHGNTIARVYEDRVSFTLAGWPTPTTRSRINAIVGEFVHANAGVYQKGSTQFYRSPDCWEGSPIPNDAWVHA